MREFVSKLLWIGNAADVHNLTQLHERGICAVIDLAFEQPVAQQTRDMIYCRFPLVDGTANSSGVLSTAIDTTVTLLRAGIPTLVACGAGMSRSPAIVAAALACFHERDADACLQEVVAGQPCDVSPALWRDVCAALHDRFPHPSQS